VSVRVLVLGLDAAEATLIKRWSASGLLPNFARLSTGACEGAMQNCMQTLPGAIWPEITSGRSCGKVPLYFHPRQLRTGEARRRPIEAGELDPREYYWSVASDAGCKVCVVDQPQTVEVPGLNGIQIREWGLHDRYFDRAAFPRELLDELEQRYGAHPVTDRQTGETPTWACDDHGETPQGYADLRQRLLAGVDNKTAILLDLLQRDNWDLFVGCWSETHCAGHQFWHYLAENKETDAEQRDTLRTTVLEVYRRIDTGLGRILDAVGPDTWILVFTSHGMGPYVGGPGLLPEVLIRLGLGSGGRSTGAALVRRLQGAVKRLPRRYHDRLRQLSRLGPVRAVQAVSGDLVDPLESPRTRAASLINNRCGAIRINLCGREPFGCVAPGAEYEQLIDDLRTQLMKLEQPGSGERIVRQVLTAREAFGPECHPDVPDLLVDFREDLGPLEACQSKSVGVVQNSNYDPNYPRTGDHTTESHLWIRGPGLDAGSRLSANVLDIAPTVLQLLGVPLPEFLDGKPLHVIDHAPTNTSVRYRA